MADQERTELEPGDVVEGRFRITRCLGRGGMGTVYEAEQLRLQRSIALKVLHPEFAGKPSAAKRFEREAKAASSIDHRNVVKILDFGHLDSGELYYTMELLQGRDLAQLLREEGALPWSRAGWIILQIVHAFVAVHGKGIVHRDVKPANCFLLDPKPGDDPDFVKLLDFGIANLQDQEQGAPLTSPADIIGSVSYMAPEQALSEPVDARTDIYALGISMYELLTGNVPFRGAYTVQILLQHQRDTPVPPRSIVPDIPPGVEAIILRTLEKRPVARFQSMTEIADALLPFIDFPGSGLRRRASPSHAPLPAWDHAGSPPPSGALGPTGTVAASQGHADDVLAPQVAPASNTALAATPSVPWQRGVSALEAPQSSRLARVESSTAVGENAELHFSGDSNKRRRASAEQSHDFAEPGLSGDSTRPADASPSATPPLTEPSPANRPHAARTQLWAPLLSATVLFAGALSATVWLQDRGEQQIVESSVVPRAPLEFPQTHDLIVESEPQLGTAAPPPEKPYNPFLDPFGSRPIRARSPGTSTPETHVPTTSVPIDELLPQEPWTLELGKIAGRVLNEQGRPLSKARICAWIVDPEAPSDLRRKPRCIEADRGGRFELLEVIPSYYDLYVFADRYLPQSKLVRDGSPLALQPGQANDAGEFTLEPGGVEIRGIVKSNTGEPVEMASVAALNGDVRTLTVTDAKGEFTLWVPEGELGVVAWAVGYADDVVVGQSADPFNLVLRREAMLFGKVIDPETHEPLTNARVRAGAQQPGVDPLVYTDAMGEFRIRALPEGMYQPEARKAESHYGEAKRVLRLLEGTISPEIAIEARRFAEEPPSPPPADLKEKAQPEPEPEPPPPPPPTPPRPPITDASLLKAFKAKLKRCGKDGAIEVRAKYVLDSGALLLPEVRVTGSAQGDSAVKACAEKHVKALRLLRRNEPADFHSVAVQL